MFKKCSKCSSEKSIEDFHKSSNRKYGVHCWCKECCIYAARARNMKKNYGITLEDYDNLRIKQNFRCYLCGTHETVSDGRGLLHVDHDHTTGEVRSLLCSSCNTGLGLFKEDVDLLNKAINYIIKFN